MRITFIGPIDKAVTDISKQLKACVEAGGGHIKHLGPVFPSPIKLTLISHYVISD